MLGVGLVDCYTVAGKRGPQAIGARARWVLAALVVVGLFVALTLTDPLRVASQDAPRLIVGGDDSFPPYEYLNDAGQPAGYNVDLIRAVARMMRVDVEIRLQPWHEARAALERGEIDLLQGMFYSPERDAQGDFSVPHTRLYHGVFARAGAPAVATPEQLRDQAIIVQNRDLMHDYVLAERLGTTIIPVESPEAALRLLSVGQHDVALLGFHQGHFLAEQLRLTNVVAVGTLPSPAAYCFAVRVGDAETLALLNEGLAILEATGEYRQIHDRWFGVREATSRWTRLLPLLVLAPIVVLLLGFGGWLLHLSRQIRCLTEMSGPVEPAREALVSTFRWQRMWLPIAIAFVLLASFVWVSELADLSHLLYGTPPRPLNWTKALVELGVIAVLGIGIVAAVLHAIAERRRTEGRLRAALQEREVLLREVHHRVRNNLAVINARTTGRACHC